MKAKLLTLLALFLIPILSNAQEGEKLISYFEFTTDFVNNQPANYRVAAKIGLQDNNLLHIPKLIDPNTGKRDKKAGFPWAITVDSIVYFNFRYCKEIQSLEMYVKPDITGKYCAIFTNKEMLRTIAANGSYYGGGLQGVLINESTKWGKNWASDNGEKIKIFIADTGNLELKHKGDYKNAAWKILTRKNLNEILGLNLTPEEIDELSIDEIKEIIRGKNSI